ncbi:2,3-diaminopropionate biosynthesis protein SbnA [Dactylosporangium matsuzakiense]|uniref:2,3-diaminopropionate biosynthesis protein SbnA n=1 Tax=Dactylosporangium matsuzakiense TaxID=53360 RepID=A0A9W6NL06_9ACTN|nr:2,3-diaminopropionate biosynthesis protein SbnA [Dactylosporangium matsuzakiense]UWZ42459.1 2,3-diaminopropionate biosynthesis protein SbnA [Dactylosporangium matsuzakiense]GLL00628.1 2,3-diaminopropionate biosynthesis protein SbnA [Dactylosporangium matsuzakiense]
MPVISTPQEFNVEDLFVDLRRCFGHSLYLKCEGFNFAGSIKLKPAVEMIRTGLRDGTIGPDTTLVESSSGNLGVALAMVAASAGLRFVCVTDIRCTRSARRLMRAAGAEVITITDPHPVDGFLGARLRLTQRLCAENDDYVWLNQYANEGNWLAHYHTTGPEILKAFPDLDVLFVGAGTTGTLMGCARYLRENRPSARVVAIDAVGSVTFGTPPGRRMIPGLGTSVRPPMLDESCVDEVRHVAEPDAIRACRTLLRHGFPFGGSTGTVVHGAVQWLTEHGAADLTAVAIAPDLGDKYLETLYHDEWVTDVFGPEVAAAADLAPATS